MTVLLRTFGAVGALAAIVAAGLQGVAAQGWGGSGDGYSRSYDPPSGYGQRPVYGQPGNDPSRNLAAPSPRCREFELQLAGGGSQSGAQDQLPRIDADMRQADADFHRAQSDADRANCYDDMFLFGRSLRRTPRCIDLDRQVQAAKTRLAQLKSQRDSITRRASPRARHDDLIGELARNNCGDQYVREYEAQRSRNSSIFSFFSDEDSDDSSRYTPSYGASAYRTLCVRECDGFFFPISDATTESHFSEDQAKCHSRCAAPAELYYHRSDQDPEQMVSLNGRPYSQMPNAFRNRKVYIRGCSCNANEYSPEEIAKAEDELKNAKRADASSGKPASDAAFARRISQAVRNAPAQPQNQPAPAAAPPSPPAANSPAPAETPPPAAPAQ